MLQVQVVHVYRYCMQVLLPCLRRSMGNIGSRMLRSARGSDLNPEALGRHVNYVNMGGEHGDAKQVLPLA